MEEQWWSKFIGLIPGAGEFYPEEDWTVLTSSTGLHLHTYRYLCNSPQAVLFIFHGLHSESNMLAHIAKKFTEANFVVLALDYANHGKSGGLRGVVRSPQSIVDDAVAYVSKGKEAYPGLPVFLLGESLGGFISVSVSLALPDVKGLVLLAPALGVSPDLEPCLRRMVKFIAFCYKGLPLKKLESATMSRNPHFAEYFEADPLTYTGRMDAGTGACLLKAFESLRWSFHLVQTPYFIIQGSADLVTSENTVREFMDTAPATDRTLEYIQDMRHAVMCEPNIEELLNKMTEWALHRVA